MRKNEFYARNISWFGKQIIILGGDFNLFLDSVPKPEGSSPVSKKIFCFKTYSN